jgi:addiction module HigA family antidote
MHNPPYPGLVIKERCLEPLGLSVTDAAKALGVRRKTLSCVINGKAGISPEMAVRGRTRICKILPELTAVKTG